jgi:hypothetical protein
LLLAHIPYSGPHLPFTVEVAFLVVVVALVVVVVGETLDEQLPNSV